jgi:transposase
MRSPCSAAVRACSASLAARPRGFTGGEQPPVAHSRRNRPGELRERAEKREPVHCRYGPHTTVYNRYNRWAKAGVWLRIFEALAAQSPQSLHLIDSSIIRAHQHAAGGKRGARITPSAVLVED